MSPSLELQEAITVALKSDSELITLIGQRVYDRVPANPRFPYVTHGPVDELSDDADCIVGFDITLQLDVWSREVGFAESKKIADAIRRTLRDAALTLSENALVTFGHEQTQHFRDPDGITNHGVVVFNSIVEQP